MNREFFVSACLSAILACSCRAETSSNAPWIGVWQGELDGQPGVTLTLADDTGELGGSVVLNMISREGGQPHVIASDPHVLMHPHLEGNTLSFQVKRMKDSRELQFAVTITANGKAQIRCLNCGPDAPVADLERSK